MCFVRQEWKGMHTVSDRQMLLCTNMEPHAAPETYAAMQGVYKKQPLTRTIEGRI